MSVPSSRGLRSMTAFFHRTSRRVESIRVLSILLTFSGSLFAAPPSASHEAPVETGPDHSKYAVGLRVGASPGTGAGSAFLLGLDLSYSPLPLFALGLDYDLIRVDNGADPGYCTGCLRNGMSWRAFGEIRPFADYPVFPFARASAGLSSLHITNQLASAIVPAFGVAGGVEGRWGHVYLRLIGFATAQLGSGTPVRGSNHLAGIAVEVGAAF